ncbi:MAG TPA: hypothetical protein VEJ63_21640 [Planctomycetota bacterium]|nr:hypothetical protein [Planctomycetota bacterium]
MTAALLMLHTLSGVGGLIAFWIAVVARKGGAVHLGAGKAFVLAVYTSVATGFVRCVTVIARPEQYVNTGSPEDSLRAMEALRSTYLFLAYLGLVTLATVRHGVRVVQTRNAPDRLRSHGDAALNLLTLLSAAAMLVLGFLQSQMLFIAMSPIGILIGAGNLRYSFRPPPERMGWWYEHMGSMLGAGIAMHTAFLVFGLRRFVVLELGVLPWIAPTLVGVPVIYIWTTYYRKKFASGHAE